MSQQNTKNVEKSNRYNKRLNFVLIKHYVQIYKKFLAELKDLSTASLILLGDVTARTRALMLNDTLA